MGRAGEAFVAELQKDPELATGLRKAQQSLRDYAAAAGLVDSILKAAQPSLDATQAIVEAMQHALDYAHAQSAVDFAQAETDAAEAAEPLYEKAERDWEQAKAGWEQKYGTSYPESLEDFVREAVAAGVDPNYMLHGKWTAAEVMPCIEGYSKRLMHSKPPASPAQVTTAELDASPESDEIGRLLALMDDNQPRIIAVADAAALSVDEKMRAICKIDVRFYGKTSPQWAALLRTSHQAICKTDFWKVDRKRNAE